MIKLKNHLSATIPLLLIGYLLGAFCYSSFNTALWPVDEKENIAITATLLLTCINGLIFMTNNIPPNR